MTITSAQVGSLLTGAANLHKNTVSDLVTGKATDITSALLSTQMASKKLSPGQSKSIDSLRSYVTDHVKGADAKKLLGNLTVIEMMISKGNTDSGSMADPVYALLSMATGQRSAQDILKSAHGSSLINQLF